VAPRESLRLLAGINPNNKISGQRVLSSRTRKVVNRAATTLRLAAMVLGKTNTPWAPSTAENALSSVLQRPLQRPQGN
jgi:hypothetical protein